MDEQITVDESTMERIYQFHAHVFEDILRVAKSGVAFAPENSLVPLLIVPLLKGSKNATLERIRDASTFRL